MKNWFRFALGALSLILSSVAGATATGIYKPLTPCTLVDTRGALPAALPSLVGPMAPGTTMTVNASGKCGLPAAFPIAAVALSYSVQNDNQTASGWVGFAEYGSAATLANAVINSGETWTSATATQSTFVAPGQFTVHVGGTTLDIVINVVGYYVTPNPLYVDDTFAVQSASSNYATLSAYNTASGGNALMAGAPNGSAIRISGGTINVAGAGVNSNTAASVYQVNTTAAYGSGGTLCNTSNLSVYSVIDNAQTNNDPNAMIFLTPRASTSAFSTANAGPQLVYVYPGGAACDVDVSGKWLLTKNNQSGFANGEQYNMLVIKQ